MAKEIGQLFPLGGPVPPELVIGREGEIEELARRLTEGASTMVAGPRRIGKTTVCDAVCARLAKDGATLVEIEVPERSDPRALLQLIIDRCNRISTAGGLARRAAGMLQPTLEKLLEQQGIPLDLSALDAEPRDLPTRAILELPLILARGREPRLVFYLDELQRVVDYTGGDEILIDLVDLYTGQNDVVVLVDGSKERAMDGMFGEPIHFGKLVARQPLAESIPRERWRDPLTARFAAAGLTLREAEREQILAWREGRPYPTMALAHYAAFSARRTKSDEITGFDVEMGRDEAERHLEDDGA